LEPFSPEAGQQIEIADAAGQQAENADAPPAADAAMADAASAGASSLYTPHPTPYTLDPTPYTLSCVFPGQQAESADAS